MPGKRIEHVIIVAGKPDFIALVTCAQGIGKPLSDTVDAPVSPAEVVGFGDKDIFQHNRETAVFHIGAERDSDTGVIVIIHIRLVRFDFLILAEEILHFQYYLVQLVHRTAFRHGCPDIEAGALRVVVIVAVKDMFGEKSQRAA